MDDTPFSVPAVAFFDRDTGELLMIGPKDLRMPASSASWSPLPTGYSDQTHSWSASARMMMEDAEKVATKLLAIVKAEAEQRKMTLLTPGAAKKTEYAEQAAEVRLFWSLGDTAAAVMNTIALWEESRCMAVFPCAMANAAQFGDTMDKAIERFAVGIGRSASKETIAAKEQRICVDIKAAPTFYDKRAIFARRAWPA